MKTLVKPLIRVHLEKPASGTPGVVGIAEREAAATPADLCLNGYRMLMHCQAASPDPGSVSGSDTPHAKLKTDTAGPSRDSRNR